MTAPVVGPAVELPPGYFLDPEGSGAWMTLPWPGAVHLPWTHPDRVSLLPPSLGWQIIAWAEGAKRSPAYPKGTHNRLVHHLTGKPWQYTPGQKRFLVLWYALDPDEWQAGRFRWLFRRGIRRGAKGTGKDPLGGTLANVELAGPVRPVGMRNGYPYGEPHRLSLVQVASNSEDQSKKLLRVANAQQSAAFRAEFAIDAGETRTQTSSGSRIECLTSESSNEGDPTTAAFLNEPHHMTPSSGRKAVAKVATRNVAKSPAELQARLLALTNAHQQGADSRAEDDFKAWQNAIKAERKLGAKRRRVDIMYDSVEADPGLDITKPEQLAVGIAQAYVQAPWADQPRLLGEAMDSETSVAEVIRFYLNGLGAAEDAWLEPAKIEARANPAKVVERGDRVAMFLDCSKSGDATALMGVRLSDLHAFTLGEWAKPRGERGKGWLAPREGVDAVVRDSIKRYSVQWFGVDPSPAEDDETKASYWMDLIDKWHRDFRDVLPVWATGSPDTKNGHAVLFDARLSALGGHERLRQFTSMAEQVAEWIDADDRDADGNLVPTITHDGDPALIWHLLNARRRPNTYGVSFGKASRDSTNLVDLAVAMVGAFLGARIVLNGKQKRQKRGKGRVF